MAAYRTDLEAGLWSVDDPCASNVPDQLGVGSGRDTVRALIVATVVYAVDFQKVPPAQVVVLDVERAHVKLEWRILLDDAVLLVGVLLAGAEVVGVHALVASDRARSGNNLEGRNLRDTRGRADAVHGISKRQHRQQCAGAILSGSGGACMCRPELMPRARASGAAAGGLQDRS